MGHHDTELAGAWAPVHESMAGVLRLRPVHGESLFAHSRFMRMKGAARHPALLVTDTSNAAPFRFAAVVFLLDQGARTGFGARGRIAPSYLAVATRRIVLGPSAALIHSGFVLLAHVVY